MYYRENANEFDIVYNVNLNFNTDTCLRRKYFGTNVPYKHSSNQLIMNQPLNINIKDRYDINITVNYIGKRFKLDWIKPK